MESTTKSRKKDEDVKMKSDEEIIEKVLKDILRFELDEESSCTSTNSFDEKQGNYVEFRDLEEAIQKALSLKDDATMKVINEWTEDSFYWNDDTEQYEQDGLSVNIKELKEQIKSHAEEERK